MRILVADDQPKVRLAMRLLLEVEPGMSVVGDASNSENLLALMGLTSPDLVLLNWGLPSMKTGELLSVIRRIYPNMSVIVLSERLEARKAALAAGADSFVSKGDPPERLLEAIQLSNLNGKHHPIK